MNAAILDELIARRRPGFSMPQPFYLDPQIFQWDLDRVFGRSWLLAGHTCQVRNPGDYFTFQIGNESLIIVRGDDGQVRALFNVCRHRGSRICTESVGHAGKFVCPYHQWVYERDGRLARAQWMGNNFDKSAFGLHHAHLRLAAGLIFACLADEPPDFEPARRAIESHLRPQGLDCAKLCHRLDYTVRANWKTLFENHRECYHCAVSHPEFCRTNYHTNMPDDGRTDGRYEQFARQTYARWQSLGLETKEINFPNGEWYRAARVPLREGYLTESLDGQLMAPVLTQLGTADTGSVRIITFPNAWTHADCDHVMSTQLYPLGPALTQVRITWLVHENAQEHTDYDVERVRELWKITTEQDIKLCENNQLGIQSNHYQPGPFSPLTEQGVETFTSWYLRRLSTNGAFHFAETPPAAGQPAPSQVHA